MFDITEAVAKLLKRSCVESYYGTITSNLVTGGYVWVSRANGVVSLKIENIQLSQNITARTPIAKIPKGFPTVETYFDSCSGTSYARFHIDTDGNIIIWPTTTRTHWATVTYVERQ